MIDQSQVRSADRAGPTVAGRPPWRHGSRPGRRPPQGDGGGWGRATRLISARSLGHGPPGELLGAAGLGACHEDACLRAEPGTRAAGGTAGGRWVAGGGRAGPPRAPLGAASGAAAAPEAGAAPLWAGKEGSARRRRCAPSCCGWASAALRIPISWILHFPSGQHFQSGHDKGVASNCSAFLSFMSECMHIRKVFFCET